MVAYAALSGPCPLNAELRPRVWLFARQAHSKLQGAASAVTDRRSALSGRTGLHHGRTQPANYGPRRTLTNWKQIQRLDEKAAERVAVPTAVPLPVARSPEKPRRILQSLGRSRSWPRIAERHFSTALRCFREGEKPDQTPSDLPLSTSSKKRLGSILGATAHENIYNIPNFLTLTRLLAAPGLAYLIVNSSHTAALGLFVYAGVTDAVDGYLARRWNQTSVVGSVVDPMADKALMTAATLALATQARLPWPLAIIILGRDVLLAISAIYYRWISLPPPKTMTRYWDFSLPSAEVHPTGISKVNTVLQLVLIGATVTMPLVPESVTVAWKLWECLVGLQWTVGVTTIWSGLSYVGSKDAVRILGKDNDASEGSSDKAEPRK